MSEKITYTDGYKYQLANDYHHTLTFNPGRQCSNNFIQLYDNGKLLIRRGYAWDGPSGPTYDTKSSMRGALVHDALYQLMREELLSGMWRPESDIELKKVCVEDGMWKWRAYLWWRSVKQMAGFAANPKNKKKVTVAP